MSEAARPQALNYIMSLRTEYSQLVSAYIRIVKEMGLTGKLIAQIEFKHGGDVFHELVKHKPHHISNIIPHLVQGCDLHEGEFGNLAPKSAGHTPTVRKAKVLIKAIEEENKLIKFKKPEGDLMEEYKDFIVTMHVGNIDMVTWTLEYETPNEDIS